MRSTDAIKRGLAIHRSAEAIRRTQQITNLRYTDLSARAEASANTSWLQNRQARNPPFCTAYPLTKAPAPFGSPVDATSVAYQNQSLYSVIATTGRPAILCTSGNACAAE